MQLYNTLGREVQEFKPVEAGKVKLYTCGPTVYDHVHLGNLRTYIFEDLLRRTLTGTGHQVQHVMNITDVDDKTIGRSREQYPDDEPKAALQKLTSHYEKVFLDDAKQLGIDLTDSKIVRATEHIEDMQALIKDIANKYVSDDGIYYDIAKDDKYGVLIKLDRSHEHHRINNDEYDKEHVADFALWKVEAPGEPVWDFEIDGKNIAGRPGWHIECSAMATKYLGQPFDIHTGGVDLIFPHHENEIAQSRAAKSQSLANFFVHAEHLLVDGKKMSKSLNNFYTVEDITKKGFEPLAFRLLVLQSHYRGQMNFSWESLDAAQTNLTELQAWADLSWQPGKLALIDKSKAKQLTDDIKNALAANLNSPIALASLNREVGHSGPTSDLLAELDLALGLNLSRREDITNEQKKIIKQREEARDAQDWKKSDELRNVLVEQGIEINDTPQGSIWSRKDSSS